MNKRPEVTEQTRERFVRAFLALQEKKDIERITVREVAELAGYNRATFYRYFSDVYAVREAIQGEIVAEIGRVFARHCHGRIIDWTVVDAMVPLYLANQAKLRAVLHPSGRSGLIDLLKREMMPRVREMLGLRALTIRQEYAFEAFFTGMTTLIGRWVERPEEVPLEELGLLARGLLRDWLLPELSAQVL